MDDYRPDTRSRISSGDGASGASAPQEPLEGEYLAGEENAVPDDLERIARLLDDIFVIPGTRIRVGFDSILGLVPGLGDLATAAPALWIVKRSVDLGVPSSVAARMLGNLLLETLIGSIPILGDLFDVAWKANRRNLRLLAKHQADPQALRRRSNIYLMLASFVLGVVALLVLLVPLLLFIALVRLAFG